MLDISSARFPDDTEIVGTLFLGYLTFLFERNPQERDNIARKYDPASIDDLVREFARVHARPAGDILIARLDGEPVGQGMVREMEPGISEIQRVFVTDAARGSGVGKALTEALVDHARHNGHRLVRLDTGRALSEAIGLYTHLGFHECPPYHAETPYLDHLIVYFERAL